MTRLTEWSRKYSKDRVICSESDLQRLYLSQHCSPRSLTRVIKSLVLTGLCHCRIPTEERNSLLLLLLLLLAKRQLESDASSAICLHFSLSWAEWLSSWRLSLHHINLRYHQPSLYVVILFFPSIYRKHIKPTIWCFDCHSFCIAYSRPICPNSCSFLRMIISWRLGVDLFLSVLLCKVLRYLLRPSSWFFCSISSRMRVSFFHNLLSVPIRIHTAYRPTKYRPTCRQYTEQNCGLLMDRKLNVHTPLLRTRSCTLCTAMVGWAGNTKNHIYSLLDSWGVYVLRLSKWLVAAGL